MKDKGMAHIGIGSAKGDEKAIEAVKLAVASPLLETTINGASHVIINISGDISLMDANDAASYVQDLAGDEANIIFGAKYDETMSDEATITVIATGLENHAKQAVPNGVGTRMVYPNAAPGGGIVNRASTQNVVNRPVTPTPAQSPIPNAASYSGIQKPKQPESTVKPVEINIPDFLKNTRR
jgi:cell division protein FtsZ